MSNSNSYPMYTPVDEPDDPANGRNDKSSRKSSQGNVQFAEKSVVWVAPSEDSLSETGAVPRVQWGSKYEFILSHIGFCIGLGNVWRFPYVCYKNGGGAFFIPYLVCLLTTGIPVVFLEISLGQYFATGGISCWDIVPIFRGVGYATTTVVFWLNIYYIVVLAWGAVYLVYCFAYIGSDLPWTTCGNDWNSDDCSVNYTRTNALILNNTNPSDGIPKLSVDPAVEFWERKILNISHGIDEMGSVQWQLAIALLIVWIVCYFCVWKGVKSSGKVVYFTAVFPYVMLIILIIRGITLDGAWDGISYYLTPDIDKLAEASVWIDAGTQIFFSYAVALGSLTALGSYNSFTYDCYKHSLYLCACDSITSFFAGFAVFSVLGFMAKDLDVSIDKVAESGPGLAFIVYPKAAAQMPGGVVWAILFFIMLLLLGLDSQFVAIEGFVTALVDVYPKLFRKGYRKEIFIGICCFVWYLIGLLTITEGGMFIFQLFDYYSASGLCLLWIAFWECMVVGWFYGADRFYDCIQLMIGYRINPWMKWGWQYAGPGFTAFIFVFSVIKHKPLIYNRVHEYPGWAEGIGYALALSSMACVPLYMIYKIIVTPGLASERWNNSLVATIPDRPEARRAKRETPLDLNYINGGKEEFM